MIAYGEPDTLRRPHFNSALCQFQDDGFGNYVFAPMRTAEIAITFLFENLH